jgi:hypothetical protein
VVVGLRGQTITRRYGVHSALCQYPLTGRTQSASCCERSWPVPSGVIAAPQLRCRHIFWCADGALNQYPHPRGTRRVLGVGFTVSTFVESYVLASPLRRI